MLWLMLPRTCQLINETKKMCGFVLEFLVPPTPHFCCERAFLVLTLYNFEFHSIAMFANIHIFYF